MADSKTKDTKQASGNRRSTEANKPKSDGAQPTEWAQTVLTQLTEAQKTWFDITTEQNSLLLETVSRVTEMRRSAPTAALSDWAKQGIEGFIEAQKRWSEIAGQQSEQILNAVRSNQNVAGKTQNQTAQNAQNAQNAAQEAHNQLAAMQTAWLDFAAKQNAQMIGAMKQTLNLDENAPAGALANLAEEAVNNYVEVQKRWLNLALQLPFLGNQNPNEPKK